MFPLWEIAIAPVLEAAGATKITEIGALAGQTTELMLKRLGPKAELHVIDPVPQFDPSEHERRFQGQYIFHRDLSLNVLKTLAPDGRRPHRRRPQLVHRLPRAPADRPRLGQRGRAAAGADPPRRVLPVRAARPLLRARTDPRRVPPALRPAGHAPGTQGPGPRRWAQPQPVTTPSRRAGPATAS